MKTKEKNKKNDSYSLKRFVEDNHKLLSTIGIFIALTVFSLNMENKFFGFFLSFLFLTLTSLLWLELLRQFPKKGSVILGWFENFLSITFLLFIIYFVIEYHPMMNLLLLPLLFAIILSVFSFVIKKLNIFNFVFHAEDGEKRGWRNLIYFIITLLALYIAVRISTAISPDIEKLLMDLYKSSHFD